MPDNAANKTALQTAGYVGVVYLSDMSGEEKLNAGVTATPIYPALNIAISVNSGSAANVKRGMRIVIRTSGGLYKGTLVVRNAGTISSANIPSREFGKGFANVIAGDVLSVYDDFPPADKMSADDDSFAPGDEAYTDQNTLPGPLVGSGGSDARWLVDASAIPFTGSTSIPMPPGIGHSLTHAWSASGGILSSATAADVTFAPGAAGKYLVTHTATDTTTSKARTQYTRVRVHDAADPPYECILTGSISMDEASGWKLRVRLLENADLGTLIDGCPVILWVPGQAFGSATPGRSHVLMQGYFERDEQNINASVNTLEFDVVSSLAKLAKLPGFSKVMLRTATPDAWSEFLPLTVFYAALKLLLDYTTLNEAGSDIILNGGTDADYSAFFLNKDNPLGQTRELAQGRACRFVCLKNGRFEIQERLEVSIPDDRDAITTTYTIDMDDVDAGSDGSDGLGLTREHDRPVETYRIRGFLEGTAANVPTFARWPEAPAMGNQSTTQEKFIFLTLVELYRWCGMFAVAADRVYQRGSVQEGKLDHAPIARVPLRGAYWAIFDLHREWIRFAGYNTASNLRGIDLTSFRWRLLGLTVEWGDDGLPRTILELAAETAGAPGVDDTPEVSATDPGIEPGWEQPPMVVPGLGNTGLYRGGPLYAFDKDNACVWYFDGAVWTQTIDLTNVGGSSISGTLLGATWRVGGNIARLITSTEQRRLTNYSSGTPALGSATAAPHTSDERSLQYERSLPDWGIAVGNYNANGVKAQYTTNDTSWSNSAGIPTNFDTNHAANTIFTGLWLSQTVPGLAYIGVFTVTGNPPTASIYKTTDYGANFSLLATVTLDVGNYPPGSIVAPFAFADGSVIFYGKYAVGGGVTDSRLLRSRAGSAVDLSPDVSGERYGPPQGIPIVSRAISVADDDPNSLAFVGINNVSAGSLIGVFLTRNAVNAASAAAANWQQLIPLASLASMPIRGLYFVSRNNLYMAGIGGAVMQWNGMEVIDLSIPGAGEIVALMGP